MVIKKILLIILILAMLAGMLVLVPSGWTVSARADIIEIPLEAMSKSLIPAPLKSGYLSDMAYEDPSLSIRIEQGVVYTTDYGISKPTYYYAAHIKVANASQLRTYYSGSSLYPDRIKGSALSKRVNAVLAINGDFFSERKNDDGVLVGYIVRQGDLIRRRLLDYRNGTNLDVLIIDENGDFTIIKEAKESDIENFEGTVINSFSFAHALVVNGELQTRFVDMDDGPNGRAQRMAIAQTGPLEYLCICCEGPYDPPGYRGMTMAEFAELIYSFGNVQNAYALDGGGCTTMVFNGNKINAMQNTELRERDIIDIIYFASAYEAD